MTVDKPTKLTRLELAALNEHTNVADAHPRQSPTPSQGVILNDFGSILARVNRDAHGSIERSAHNSFFRALGQGAYPRARTRSFYSSSIAIDVVSRVVAGRGSMVVLVAPTFDNIHDLLEARGLRLNPVTEHALLKDDPRTVIEGAACLFVTSPNNPTGWVVDGDRLTLIARCCSDAGVLLAIDSSFRGFDLRAQYDMYAILEASGVDYLVVEDTGKLWPMHELKLGFLAYSASMADAIEDAADDYLLSVSPIILELVSRLAQDAASGGFEAMRELVETNRAVLAGALEHSPAEVVCPDSRVSVALVKLPPGASACEVSRHMAGRGVHVLPANAFFWTDPSGGERYIRVALSRDAVDVARAGAVLAEVLDHPRPPIRSPLSVAGEPRERRIVNLSDVSPSDPFAEMVAGFRAIAANRAFPCPFVARAVARSTIWCGQITSSDVGIHDAHNAIGDYLEIVNQEANPKDGAFHILLLGCAVPDRASGEQVREIAWDLLLKLSAFDAARGFSWPDAIPTQIDDPQWAYCLREVPFFVNVSSDRLRGRRSRNLGYGLTLVFQPREGIDFIAPPGAEGDQLREHIRRRIDRYDAIERSPELSSFGASDSRDWRQVWLEDANVTSDWKPPISALSSEIRVSRGTRSCS